MCADPPQIWSRMTSPWLDARRLKVLICCSGVSFMIMLDSNIVGVALPSIARTFHAAFSDIEWVVSGYILTFAALLMTGGALADKYGRRKMLIIGIALFAVSSALCGMAPSAAALNAARALQGIGAAIQLSANLAVLGHEFRGPDRAKAFGVWGAVLGVAAAIGPFVGGVITSLFGWQWAFLVNTPICVALIVLTLNSVNESTDPEAGQLDIIGMITFAGALSLLVWALINANVEGWRSWSTLSKFIASVILFACFLCAEKIQKRPMMDLSFFRKRTFIGSACAMFGFASSAQVMMTYLPLYLQNVFGFSAANAGVGMLPFALPLFFCPRIAASLSTKINGKMILITGLAIVAAGNLLTAYFIHAAMAYWSVACGMFATGCGAGILNGETAKVSMSVIPPERAGMASGISATVRFVGLVTAVTGLGALLAGQTYNNLVQSTTRLKIAIAGDGNLYHVVSRITAGDIHGFVASMPQEQRTLMLSLCRSSFGEAFAALLVAAGCIAIAACFLVFVTIDSRDTAPDKG
jgi:EmrB/QacA subfamily drug resistance transporter